VRRDALAAGLVAVCLWGLAPVATRAVVTHLSPLPLLLIRLAAASLVLLPWAWPVFRRLRPRQAGRLAAAGVLGLVGYNLPVTAGLRWLPAATAGLLLATEPVWVMLLGRVFLGERSGRRAWLGSAAALAGVAVLAGPGAVGGVGGGYRALAGTGLVLAGTLSFAAYTIVLRRSASNSAPFPRPRPPPSSAPSPTSPPPGRCRVRGSRTSAAPPGRNSRSSRSAARWPACCCGTSPCSPGTSPGSACCSTWNQWSACSARRRSSAST
jgi:drug/metabolite transporter (DMT)-like permease